MSSSTPSRSPRFLLDENVRVELAGWLRARHFDVTSAPRATSDATLAAWSKRDRRILVTNDEDFCSYDTDDLYAVVWLRIPQNNPQALLSAFSTLLTECSRFTGRLILLRVTAWTAVPLSVRVRRKKS